MFLAKTLTSVNVVKANLSFLALLKTCYTYVTFGRIKFLTNNLKKRFKNKTVLITGHTGFKGSWLTIWLKKLGAHIIGVSVDVPTIPSLFAAANLSDRIDDYRFNIVDTDRLKTIIMKHKPDFIFHMAAQPIVLSSFKNPFQTWSSNLMGTISVLESLNELEIDCSAIFITSDKCYENVNSLWGYKETDRLGGNDPYSASKAAAEIALRSYITSFFKNRDTVKICIGRAGNVIGGGDWAEFRLIPDCIKSWSQNSMVEIRNPNSTRPWQHVLEPLSGYLNLALSVKHNDTLCGEPFNFGPLASETKSVKEVVSYMADRWQTSNWKVVDDEVSSNKEHNLLQLNCEKAAKKLGWYPVWDFEDTVNNTIDWYRNFYENGSETIMDFTSEQIDQYCVAASGRCLEWAM